MAQQLQEFCDALVQKHVDGKMNQESEHLIQRYTKAWSRDFCETVSVFPCWLQISDMSNKKQISGLDDFFSNDARSCARQLAVRSMASTMPSVASWMPYAMPCCKRCNTTSTSLWDLMIPNSQQLDLSAKKGKEPVILVFFHLCFRFLDGFVSFDCWFVDVMCFEKLCRG